jgi:hypothetical protein
VGIETGLELFLVGGGTNVYFPCFLVKKNFKAINMKQVSHIYRVQMEMNSIFEDGNEPFGYIKGGEMFD